ncbi:ROK family protein [Pediococcus pentosaceus]|jgi:predicted NBD/HSP70 family sugar kinase|uniref:ROK family protein n=1 Tax=Pediococcus pentosaceus TaxID=1255 RepID=UPI0018A13D40|nr:ROK family protein [Pediococcus pentosaceus]MBF7123578.1 ROK family protein [Pediococcus pentosaceus]MCR1861376.1 ROK family protein [Pediococcus pentosaceus]
MTQSINQDSMRDLNLKVMLQFLFNHPQTSRIEIANNLNLNKSTISSLYTTLNKQGYISEIGYGDSSVSGGRRPMLIKFNRHYGYTINFELGHHHLRMMINWLTGEKITFNSIPVVGKDIFEILSIMKDKIQSISIPVALHQLLGISIAINGIVDHNHILDSPFIDMQNVDLINELAEFNVPVILENEANLAAIATRDYFTQHKLNHLIALDIHNGIGAGIIINGQLYRGNLSRAGELGRSLFLPFESSNSTIHIEELYSEDAIIKKFGELKHIPHIDRNGFLEYYRADDQIAIQIMNEFTEALVYVLFNINQIFSPELISLQSRIIGEIPELVTTIKQRYTILSNQGMTTKIKISNMIEDAPLYGGASLLAHSLLSLDHYQLQLRL